MPYRVSVVIPARNEAGTVGAVVGQMLRCPRTEEVIVVDHNSDDGTAGAARDAGAKVVHCSEGGYGTAVKAGIAAARNDLVFKIDADIVNPDPSWIDACLKNLEGQSLVKGTWSHKAEEWPMAHLLVRPAFHCLLPELRNIELPTSGIYLLNRQDFNLVRLNDDWSFDVQLVVEATYGGRGVVQCFLGLVEDRIRPPAAYQKVSREILAYLLNVSKCGPRDRLLVVMAHPDDAEIWCGGTLVKYLSAGATVYLVIATSDAERRAEAELTAAPWPNLKVHFLGGEDMRAFARDDDLFALRRAIEDAKARVLVTHHPGDPHRDHRACFEAVQSALLLAGRKAFPDRLLTCNSYFAGSSSLPAFTPNLFVDISAEAETKYRHIRNHRSQDPEYWIEMAKRTDALYGMKTGVMLSEAFQIMSFYTSPASSLLV